ncbi:family 16 glycosylhydrolase [Pedobacter glucosidilyticus]|uniref:family 16 glycosylhydrolase n=1 Tax=Pedobacter glucosidilyticus TaxID=1122941 RepID=UPI0009DB7885|nr:family 16 glycosylhydrolase [Pedobacter glucosidilyticus]
MQNLFLLCVCMILCSCGLQKSSQRVLLKEDFSNLDTNKIWLIKSHTFANNLAVFNPDNIQNKNILELVLSRADSSKTSSKSYEGAEIRTRRKYKYGNFKVQLKAPKGSGIVSGFFLYFPHSSKFKEIDFEFLGKDTCKVYLNHWINKQDNGKALDIPFAFQNGFHEYHLEWRKNFIAWYVDGKELYRTQNYIPKRSMHLVFNIWISKHENWVGKLDENALPAIFQIKQVEISK